MESGSLLVMHDQAWSHAIPPQPDVMESTIILTFRRITPFVPTILPGPANTEDHTEDDLLKRALDEALGDYKIEVQPTKRRCRRPTTVPPVAPESTLCEPQPSTSAEPTREDSPLPPLYIDFPPAQPDPMFLDMTPFYAPVENPAEMELPQNDWLTQLVQSKDCLIKAFPLGDEIAVTVQVFKGELGIHVRQFFRNAHGELCPSKSGVRMNSETFYEFSSKIFGISLVYSSESTVINNAVLALVKEETLELRQFTDRGLHPHSIVLLTHHLNQLKLDMSAIENCVLDYMFRDRLKSLVCENIPYHTNMNSALDSLKNLVKEEVISKIEAKFPCESCKFGSLSQHKHSCMNTPVVEKYQTVGHSIRLLCDIEKIAEQFLSSHAKLSSKMYFEIVYRRLFD